MDREKHAIRVYVTPELYAQLARLAEIDDQPVAGVARRLLVRAVAREMAALEQPVER